MTWTEEQKDKALRTLSAVATALYALFLVWALWLKVGDEDQIMTNYLNVSILTEEQRWMVDSFLFKDQQYLVRQILEIVLNCFVFAPFGLTLCLATKGKKVWAHVIFCILFSLAIELTQRYTWIGGFSLIDLSTNVVGYFIGFGAYKLIFVRFKTKTNLIITAAIAGVLTASLIYAVVSVVLIKDTLNYIFSQL